MFPNRTVGRSATLILLGYRSAFKEDIKATPAEMTYGNTIRLPGEFFESTLINDTNETEFISNLRKRMRDLRPTTTSNHAKPSHFIEKQLSTATAVFVRNDTVRRPLQPPYDGPYQVLKRNDKFYQLEINGKKTNVSIDRLKAAHLVNDDREVNQQTTTPTSSTPIVPTSHSTGATRSGRRVRLPIRYGGE